MKFLASTQIHNGPHLLTGEQTSAQDRFRSVVDWAMYAEELGFDAVGVGERHATPFLSSSPPAVLSYLAARTTRVRLFATVALRLRDPVRVAEDYATLDQLSAGRLELVIDEGDDPHQSMVGSTVGDQWERNRENHALLRRLWRDENVTWEGTYRPALRNATTQPRPFQRPTIPIWHGSASSEESTEWAARWGAPLFTANGFHPWESYAHLVRRYRERWEDYGNDPAEAVVGAGCGGLYVARSSQEAISTFRPYYQAFLRTAAAKHQQTPFTSLEDTIAHGSALVGSPQQVLEKIFRHHQAFGHEVLSIGIDGLGIPVPHQRASLELFFAEVAPVLRRELPSRLWGPWLPPVRRTVSRRSARRLPA